MGSKYRQVYDYSTKCPCGKGTIDHYKLIIESDFPPFEKEQRGKIVNNCEECSKKEK